MWYTIILIIISLIVILVCQSVRFHSAFSEDIFKLRITVAGICVFNNRAKKKAAIERVSKEASATKDLTLDSIREYLPYIGEIFDDMKAILRYSKRKIKSKRFVLYLEFGAEDAATTGIISGMLWSLIGSMYPILDSAVKLDNPIIDVRTVFHQNLFRLTYEGIYRIKIYHIIIIGAKSVRTLIKLIKKMKRTV